ncbi:hypothetical protein ABZP36_025331 [Zizania latifolia]
MKKGRKISSSPILRLSRLPSKASSTSPLAAPASCRLPSPARIARAPPRAVSSVELALSRASNRVPHFLPTRGSGKPTLSSVDQASSPSRLTPGEIEFPPRARGVTADGLTSPLAAPVSCTSSVRIPARALCRERICLPVRASLLVCGSSKFDHRPRASDPSGRLTPPRSGHVRWELTGAQGKDDVTLKSPASLLHLHLDCRIGAVHARSGEIAGVCFFPYFGISRYNWLSFWCNVVQKLIKLV